MKIRRGFVSNSSSSCFICNICGTAEICEESDPSEGGFFRFNNCGHIVCEHHILYTEEYKKEYREHVRNHLENSEDEYDRDTYNRLKNIESFNEFRRIYEMHFDRPENISGMSPCPICNLSCVSSDTLLEYIFKVYDLPSKKDLEKEIKREFKNLEGLDKFLKE